MMELDQAPVHRNLESGIRFFGLELFDLMAVLLLAATMNLIFGRTSLSIPFVFVLPSIVTMILYIAKRNKPDRFLLHLIRFAFLPGVLTAGESSEFENRKVRVNAN